MASFRLSTLRRAILFATRPWLWQTQRLEIEKLGGDPFAVFEQWYESAQKCWQLEFPDAMCLSTIGPNGNPEGRMVLLKGFSRDGFVFYTNSESRKGLALRANPRAALTFYWEPYQRQIRIVGSVSEVGDEVSDEYFATRPRRSQLGAWASKQSSKVTEKGLLEKRLKEFTDKYRDQVVPRPSYWKGFSVRPFEIEFWQLRANRLHDRISYTLDEDQWSVRRLFP